MEPVPHIQRPPLSARRLFHAVGVLLAASGVCLGLLLARVAWSHTTRFDFLVWNLFLAWIPLLLSLSFVRWRRSGLSQGVRAVLWLLFFPNAFYLVTDMVHLKKFGSDGVPGWYDLMMTSSYSLAGVFLAILSLYLLHHEAARRFGRGAGWSFALGALALGAVGIYLGRIFRLNSWDVVAHPWKISQTAAELMEPSRLLQMAAFSAVVFAFSLVAYCFVLSIAWLHADDLPSEPAG